MTHTHKTLSKVSNAAGSVVIWQQQDDPQDPLALTLARQNYQRISVATEGEVLKSALESVPDLLIIHLKASGEDGYKLCKTLRRLPRTGAIPVVFVGIRDQASELVEVLRCGGSEYLQMPMAEEECWLRLARHLHAVRLVRKLEADKASLHQQIWTYNHILQQHEQRQASLAKENQALQRMAFVDGLTQVGNRHSFNQQMPLLWQAAQQNQQPISLLLCDIDYFKRYNDSYGHPAGDACLQAVASSMVRGANRHSDQISRYGGEEFAILLPATDSKGARQVALAVQSELARIQLPHRASLVKPFVSLSIGICTLVPENPQQSYEILIHGADEALYTAKLRGRDRVVVNTADGLVSMVQTHCRYKNLTGDRNTSAKKLLTHPALTQARPSAIESDPWPQSEPAAFTIASVSTPTSKGLPGQTV
ncbi:MAG: diguanylate cyclase [Phormidesmis sp.]